MKLCVGLIAGAFFFGIIFCWTLQGRKIDQLELQVDGLGKFAMRSAVALQCQNGGKCQ